jgi:hypothetical protein
VPNFATKITAPTGSTGVAGINCHGTLRSGYAFISKDYHMVYDTNTNRRAATANSYQCLAEDQANCGDAYTSGALKTDFIKGSTIAD